MGFRDRALSDFTGPEPLKLKTLPGSWKAGTDGTGTISLTVEPDPDAPTKRAMHFIGSNHTRWGGDVSISFVDDRTPIELLGDHGIELNVKGTVDGGAVYGKFQMYDSFVPGCGCDPSPTAPNDLACYGGFITEVSVGTPLLSGWNNLYFLSFRPTSFGYHKLALLDPTQLINFSILVQSTGSSVSWDLWISEVNIF